MVVPFGIRKVLFFTEEELERVQKRTVRFVAGNYNYETGEMNGIIGQLKWKSLKKRRKATDSYYYTND